jgi:hypothetical protein
MNNTAWIVCGVAVIAIVVAILFGKKLGIFKLELFGQKVDGRRAVETGAHADDSVAEKGSINVQTNSGGSATADRSKAGQDIVVKNNSGR